MKDFNAHNDGEDSESLYSYSYRDKKTQYTVHDGDYDARRDTSDPYREYTEYDQNRWKTGQEDRGYHSFSGSDFGQKEPKHRNGFGRKILTCVILAVVFGLVSGGIFAGMSRISREKTQKEAAAEATDNSSNTSVGTTSVAQEEKTTTTKSVVVSDVSGIVENVMPSIVAITNMSQTEYYNMFGQSKVYDSESCGSGIIISSDDTYLYIVTNNHVVSDAQSLTIGFCDDSTVTASVKGTDAGSDLAVLSVKKSELDTDTLKKIKVATVGDSGKLKAGQSAIAIGNALGYGQSVTTGVISALNREVTTSDKSSGTSTTNELIQTDAAINPGNSGGALLNDKGEVIGINSVKYSDTDVEGMGYAIPTATAKPIVDELITRQVADESERAVLGITGIDVTSEVSDSYNMPEGIYVAKVSLNSAAQKAGLKRGDIITTFDGHSVDSMDALDNQMQYYTAGTKVEVVVQRASNGSYAEKKLEVTLGSKK